MDFAGALSNKLELTIAAASCVLTQVASISFRITAALECECASEACGAVKLAVQSAIAAAAGVNITSAARSAQTMSCYASDCNANFVFTFCLTSDTGAL